MKRTHKMIALLKSAKRRLFRLRYHVDTLSYRGNTLHISGWLYDSQNALEQLALVLRSREGEVCREIIRRGLRREDVYSLFQEQNGMLSGFDQHFCLPLPATGRTDVFLRFTVNGNRNTVRVGRLDPMEERSAALLPLHPCVREQFTKGDDTIQPLPQSVDIIIPVYNGYEYLEKLFDGLRRTDAQHRVLLLDDNSPDERVLPRLKRFAGERKNVFVFHNEQNLGFVKTVNLGLRKSKNHVVILNTDVELPRCWIERLMAPILRFEKVASVTPFSNCATIFSFPMLGDNGIYHNLSVDELDRHFRCVSPEYTLTPTGVGFCMGMNRKALNAVGLLDEKLFEKGYGEENDWCQRAVKAGFCNVHAENLFVYHKHGGSFLPEEKKRLIEAHTAALTKRYPNYLADVEGFVQADPLRNLRAHIRFRVCSQDAGEGNVLVLTHALGGGADMYLNTQIPKWRRKGKNVFVLRYVNGSNDYRMTFHFPGERFELVLADWDDLLSLIQECALEEIVINELATYPSIFSLLAEIRALKQSKGARLTMLIHDYLAVSPSLNLLSSQDYVYARKGGSFHCDTFYEQDGWAAQYDCPTVTDWRHRWESFLLACDEVRCFSEDSRRILTDVYPSLPNLTVVPHRVEYMPQLQKRGKTTTTLNIGVLGTLALHKGKQIVRRLWELTERENRNIKIVLIGEEEGSPIPIGAHFEKTGGYSVEDVPRLVLEKDIDLFLLPSIWPETFSYTAEEIIQMGMPIACLDLGAPAERVRRYEKGLVLSSGEPDAILRELYGFAQRLQIAPVGEKAVKRYLFVAEYLSFSSRYRVDHAREQLLTQGIASDFVEAKNLDRRIDLGRYQGIYIYRCRNLPPLKQFLQWAKGKLPIVYDIDDFIFDYHAIKSMDFLQQDEYADFEAYSGDILNCMQLCTAFVTSTETLADAIRSRFPGRRVFVNRNRASAGMYVLSRKAVLTDSGHKGTVMGYFSGSKTHDQDFAMIEDALLRLMEKHPSLYLLIGGCCRISPTFDRFKDRVIHQEFVSWRELPALIRSVDINLMPLVDNFFNRCKSENKWMEAALVERVTVASRSPELAAAVETDKIVYWDTEMDFERNLSQLIESQEVREKTGKKAYQWVCKEKLTIRDSRAFAAYLLSFNQG